VCPPVQFFSWLLISGGYREYFMYRRWSFVPSNQHQRRGHQ
jgi:hypothetical protein